MNKNAILILAITVQHLFAGVYVVADTTAIAPALAARQAVLAEAVASFSEGEYVFGKPDYPSHITLACIEPKASLSMGETKEKFSGIAALLQQLAAAHIPVEVSTNIAQSKIEVWQSNYPLTFDGKERRNYVWLVMKLSENGRLTSLAQAIQDALKKEYGIVQTFPFSAHLTVGRVYAADDSKLPDELIAYLRKLSFSCANNDIQLSRFKLSAHDGSAEYFELGS